MTYPSAENCRGDMSYEVLDLKQDVKLMKFVIAALALSSFSLIFTIFGDYNGNTLNVIVAVTVGVVFWLFLILGYVVFSRIAVHRKQYEKTQNISRSDNDKPRKDDNKKKPGIICFFSNPYAVAADIALLVSLAVNVIFLFIPSVNQVAETIFIAILVFSLHMHCILNGVNFKYTYDLSNSKQKKGE